LLSLSLIKLILDGCGEVRVIETSTVSSFREIFSRWRRELGYQI